MHKVLPVPASIVVVIAAFSFSATAQAQITIGQLAPGISPMALCENGADDGAASGPAAAAYTVPIAGVITSWSTNAAAGVGQKLNFKVYRPLGEGKYLVVGHDGPRVLTPSATNTFRTSIPVEIGDVVGNATNASSTPTACEFKTGNTKDETWVAGGDAADGPTIQEAAEQELGVRNNESATILPAPALSALTPVSGPISGGSSVAIGGTNLAEVRAVDFGTTPALSFTVSSESQISAVAPPSASIAAVSVTVTTIAGTATAPGSFAYLGCAVPKLNGKKLKVARKKLRTADCKLGKVKNLDGVTSRTGTVKGQSLKAGKVLAPGSKVSIRLG